jgi:hypothetical protein
MHDRNLIAAAKDLDNNWREREATRMRDGTYELLPTEWYDWLLPEHYAHRAKSDPKQVAFTPDSEKGMRDRQTIMNVGRYLTRYYAERFTGDNIRTFVTQVTPSEVQFAASADDIATVYEHGPNSCMSGTRFYQARSYLNNYNPVRIYAGHDLQVAYIGDKNNASARCLVWPERKLRGRIYGDHERLEAGLRALGYSEAASFNGAMVTRHEIDVDYDGSPAKALVMPYIDAGYGLIDHGDKCEIVGHDRADFHRLRHTETYCPFEGQATVRSVPWRQCAISARRIIRSRGVTVRNARGARLVIHPDLAATHAWQSCISGNWYLNEVPSVETREGKMTQAEKAEYYATCAITGGEAHVRSMTHLHDGRLVLDDVAFRCRYSDGYYPLSERVVLADGTFVALSHMRTHSVIDAYTGEAWPRSGTYRLHDGRHVRRAIWHKIGFLGPDDRRYLHLNEYQQLQLALQAAE